MWTFENTMSLRMVEGKIEGEDRVKAVFVNCVDLQA